MHQDIIKLLQIFVIRMAQLEIFQNFVSNYNAFMVHFRLNEYVSCMLTFACIIIPQLSSRRKAICRQRTWRRSSTIQRYATGRARVPSQLRCSELGRRAKERNQLLAVCTSTATRGFQFNNAAANNEFANGNGWLGCLPSFAFQGTLRSFHGASFGNRAEQNVEYGRPLV